MQFPVNTLLAWLAFSFPFIAAPALGNAPDSQRRAYHLLVATNAEAARIREEISARGGDRKAFREAVRKHSKDVTTKPLGGDLGWIKRQEGFEPAFLDAAFALKPGTVSQPVETKYGWHLIFIEEEKNGKSEQTPDDNSDSKAEEAAEGPARAEAIVKRYLKVIGGVEALDAIVDRTTRFKVIKHESTGDSWVRITLFLKRGHKYREDWTYENLQAKDKEGRFAQGYDSKEGWFHMLEILSPLEGKSLQHFVWDKHIDDFFRHWEEDGYRLTYDGAGKVEDEVVEIVTASEFTGRLSTRFLFSKSSGLLLKKEWQDPNDKQRTLTREQYFTEYEKVPFADGSGRFIRFSRRHEMRVNGKPDRDLTFEEVSFNTGLADKLFERPEGKPFTEPAGKPKSEDG
jgi:hypothetical protein